MNPRPIAALACLAFLALVGLSPPASAFAPGTLLPNRNGINGPNIQLGPVDPCIALPTHLLRGNAAMPSNCSDACRDCDLGCPPTVAQALPVSIRFDGDTLGNRVGASQDLLNMACHLSIQGDCSHSQQFLEAMASNPDADPVALYEQAIWTSAACHLTDVLDQLPSEVDVTTPVGCAGDGFGHIESNLTIAGIHYPLTDELATGNMEAQLAGPKVYAEALSGTEAYSYAGGAGVARYLKVVALPTFGDAVGVQCSNLVAKTCAGKVCAKTTIRLACSESSTANLLNNALIQWTISTSLTNAMCLNVEVAEPGGGAFATPHETPQDS
jgi:hypothetical protein